jgi:solute carrier family 25 (mitochondrial carnitine/acylcarnitine transporter), member 20/29
VIQVNINIVAQTCYSQEYTVEVNNTLIYFIARPLTPPLDPLTTAIPSLDFSSFLTAIFSTSLADKLKTSPRSTFLMPNNNAFKRLGMLVTAHLLSSSSKLDLENVIQHHVIKGVEYKDSLVNGSQRTYGTLEGSDLHVTRKKAKDNSTLILSASGGWADMHSVLYPSDTLTQTGVIHEVSDIMIPRSVNLTIGKLMRAAKGTTMLSLVSKAGMEWILNGTAPPEGSEWADLGLDKAGWTLLCPTDDAFKGLNLTEIYADAEAIRDIVMQHLIPVQRPSQSPPEDAFLEAINENRPIDMDDSASYTTLLSTVTESLFADLVFRTLEGGSVVGVKGARGADGKSDWARVMAWGRTTTGGGTGGVVQIDRLLLPYYPSPWVRYGGPIAVAIGGVALIGAFFYGVRAVWKRDTTEATYEPVGGFGQEDDDS